MKIHISYISAILILIGVICFLFWLWNGARIQANQKDSVINELNAKIQYHTNKEGELVSQKEAALLDLDNLKKYYPELVKDINTKLDIKTKNILAAIQASFATLGQGTGTIIHEPDSTGKVFISTPCTGKMNIFDGYLKFDADIHKDKLDYKYEYIDTLTLAFSRKIHFFKGETIAVSGSFSNKKSKITGEHAVLIQTVKPKRFNISIGIYYDPFRQTYGPAVTAGYALVRF